jgi:hypothetical protein
VSRFPIPHARRIVDATVEEMLQINWGAAVLAATYRGLCTKTGTQSILLGCLLLLHLWSYERLPSALWRRGTTQQTGRPWGRCGASDKFVL